ncbi:hypothetical protein ACJJTC_003526 [Scirpophaga incertulas]
MFHTPPRMETRSKKWRREQTEKKLLEHQQAFQSCASDINPSASCSNNLRGKLNIENSIKSEPTAHAIHHSLPTMCATKAASSKGSKMSSASKEARKKQLVLEAAKQKASIQMDIIDKTLEAQLAALSDEEELEEYSSQIGNDLPRREVADWVEHQSSRVEEQQEQFTYNNGVSSGKLHHGESASNGHTQAPGTASAPPQPLPDDHQSDIARFQEKLKKYIVNYTQVLIRRDFKKPVFEPC